MHNKQAECIAHFITDSDHEPLDKVAAWWLHGACEHLRTHKASIRPQRLSQRWPDRIQRLWHLSGAVLSLGRSRIVGFSFRC